MEGTLFICGTPIGNLKDITIRCIETLQMVDMIVAEDTRHTIKLLNHYNIKKTLESYHEHNKNTKGEKIIMYLKQGKNIALVSDAGMPSISDPGQELICLCYQNNLNVVVVPGATACVSALVISAFNSRSYCFEGFLPVNKKMKKEIVCRIKNEKRTTIIYEAPHNIKSTLEYLLAEIGNRKIALCKELTKKHENVKIGHIDEILQHLYINEPKGEFVLVIDGNKNIDSNYIDLDEKSIKQQVDFYISQGFNVKDSIKKVAKENNINKRDVYSMTKIKND